MLCSRRTKTVVEQEVRIRARSEGWGIPELKLPRERKIKMRISSLGDGAVAGMARLNIASIVTRKLGTITRLTK